MSRRPTVIDPMLKRGFSSAKTVVVSSPATAAMTPVIAKTTAMTPVIVRKIKPRPLKRKRVVIDEVLDDEDTIEKQRIAKRRKLLEKQMIIVPVDDIKASDETPRMFINVKQYTVQLWFEGTPTTAHFQCNCGEQFGLGPREYCKHVGCVVTNMMKTYVSLFTSKGAIRPAFNTEMSMDDLQELFDAVMNLG